MTNQKGPSQALLANRLYSEVCMRWWRERQGARHEIWTNGKEQEPLPRHSEIIESLAKEILRTARQFPGKGR